jgi:hypothetical protein
MIQMKEQRIIIRQQRLGLSVAHQLRMYRQLGGLQRSIEQARGELEMLNITITQKQEVITVFDRFVK